jgi:SulP family sulfate permease
MLAILVLFSGIVGRVVIPTLAAVLMYAAIGSLRSGPIGTILRTGRGSQIAFAATVLATIFLPVVSAVGVGVTLSLLLQLNREALDLKVVRLEPLPGGRFAEGPAPTRLRSHAVTLLDVYGSLYYAGAKTLAARLPETAGAERPAVVVRLRGRTRLGASAVVILDAYAERLAAGGGRLIVSGVTPELVKQLRRTGREHLDADVTTFPAADVIGDSSDAAYREAERWLAAGAKAGAVTTTQPGARDPSRSSR